MSDENFTSQERSETPTPRRREQARQEGRVARSPELSGAVTLMAGVVGLAVIGGSTIAAFLAGNLRESAAALAHGPLTAPAAAAALRTLTMRFVLALLPFAAATVGAALVAGFAQTRGMVSWQAIQPKWSRINPGAGLKRLIGIEGAFAMVKALAKFAVLALVTVAVLRGSWPELVSLSDMGPQATVTVLRALMFKLAASVGLAFLLIALADFAFQWVRHERSLRMTRDEVRRENRDTEGDPLMKGRMLALARARARRRMLQRVPTADVVVVNPTEIAVALRYDVEAAPAPIVVAMGQRKLAERIRAIARKAGVPVVENRTVARALLATATVGRPIPPALYVAVAEILAFVYRQRGRSAERMLGEGTRP